MIFRDSYYLNNVFNKLEDNHNMISIVNNKKRNLIVYCIYTYREEHNKI